MSNRKQRREIDKAVQHLMQFPEKHARWGQLFEEFATAAWDGDDKSMLEEYLQQRGWREGAHGLRR